MKDRSPPRSADMLSRWADAYARQTGQDVARVRRWISFMALGGALEQAGFEGDGPRFSIKGGVALELRLGGRARATRDVDLVLHATHGDLTEALDDLLQNRCEGFSFRRRGEVRRLGAKAVRAEVAVQYGGGTWGRIQVDLARNEGDRGMEVEMVEGLDLSFFRFDFPERVPCLSLYAQAAQKIHAVSRPSRPGWQNERFKDLVDLLLIEELIKDHGALRKACEEVFAIRNTHPWPPFIVAPMGWAEPFRRMASEVGLPVTDVNQATFLLRRLLKAADPDASVFKTVPVPRGTSASNWYYAIGQRDLSHRVPAAAAEALIQRRSFGTEMIRPEWYRDPGGIFLVEVTVFLRDRVPLFLAGTAIHPILVGGIAEGTDALIGPEVWRHLSAEILRRAKANTSSRDLLAGFLASEREFGTNVLGEFAGLTMKGVLSSMAQRFGSGDWTSPLWSFEDDDLVIASVS